MSWWYTYEQFKCRLGGMTSYSAHQDSITFKPFIDWYFKFIRYSRRSSLMRTIIHWGLIFVRNKSKKLPSKKWFISTRYIQENGYDYAFLYWMFYIYTTSFKRNHSTFLILWLLKNHVRHGSSLQIQQNIFIAFLSLYVQPQESLFDSFF